MGHYSKWGMAFGVCWALGLLVMFGFAAYFGLLGIERW
jgi:hypothetical protein